MLTVSFSDVNVKYKMLSKTVKALFCFYILYFLLVISIYRCMVDIARHKLIILKNIPKS